MSSEIAEMHQHLIKQLRKLINFCEKHNLMEMMLCLKGLLTVTTTEYAFYSLEDSYVDLNKEQRNKMSDNMFKVDCFLADILSSYRNNKLNNINDESHIMAAHELPECVNFEFTFSKN